MRAIAIGLVACAALAAVVAWSTNQMQFATWLRFTLVAFAAVYLFSFFIKRARMGRQLNGGRH